MHSSWDAVCKWKTHIFKTKPHFKFDISIVFADDHFANVLNRAALYIKVILTFPISKSADGFKVISQITMEKLLFVAIREND